jgi:hypothetical protein
MLYVSSCQRANDAVNIRSGWAGNAAAVTSAAAAAFSVNFLKSRPTARSKKGPVIHRGPVGNLCDLHAACVIIHAAIPPSTMAGTVASNATAMTERPHKRVPVISSIFSQSYERSRMLLTDFACHWPPRAVATPLAFSASAMSLRVVAPAFCASRVIESTLAAYLSASALTVAMAFLRAA